MRAMSLNLDLALRDGERPVPVVLFANAYGVRVWSVEHPPKLADAEGDEHIADGTWIADGSITAGGGLGPILDRGGRVIEIGAIEEGNPEVSLEDSQGETDPAGVSIALSNDDGALGYLEAEENILSAQVRVDLIQAGALTWADKTTVFDGRVVEYTLTRERLTLACREM